VWQDVLDTASACADFFDIDWQPPSESLQNRVLLPVLGDHYGLELAAGKLALDFESASGSFAVRYHEHRLPIDPREYPRILQVAVSALDAAGDELRHPAQSLRHLAEAFAGLPPREVRDRPRMDERNLRKEVAKGRLASLARSHREVADAISRAVESFRGRSDDPASFDALHELLERQPYRLAYWRVAQDDINYRRFFDINDLAALRQENDAVFNHTHRLILDLVKEQGGRVARGPSRRLFDPRDYFRRLQAACPKPIYLVVEKIVAPFENLHEDWAVHGTTGYRFANVVNGLFVDPAAESRLTRTYTQFIGNDASFEELARASRRMILRTALASELTGHQPPCAYRARRPQHARLHVHDAARRPGGRDRLVPGLPDLHRRGPPSRRSALHRLGGEPGALRDTLGRRKRLRLHPRRAHDGPARANARRGRVDPLLRAQDAAAHVARDGQGRRGHLVLSLQPAAVPERRGRRSGRIRISPGQVPSRERAPRETLAAHDARDLHPRQQAIRGRARAHRRAHRAPPAGDCSSRSGIA
jgi:hypothetical protein